MSLTLDAVYAVVAVVTAPWWMRKARGGWGERFGRVEALGEKTKPRVVIHAVSVGEVNLIRPLVDRLVRDGRVEVVVSATTDTGIARAREVFGGAVRVVRYPLDASWAVRRFLDAVRPDGVALVELELWPNFAKACEKRGVPLAVINGRLSARSFKRYRLGRGLVGRYFRQLAFAAVQDGEYAARFRAMGVGDTKCVVAGTMKWDAAGEGGVIGGADGLAREMGIDRGKPLIVAGSTAPGEHELMMAARPTGVQLLCAPRRPEWFDEAAAVMKGCVRRSGKGDGAAGSGLFLLDTIGELRKAYALADLVVVGRSFGKLHGSDPMEPAALGKAVVIGPRFGDFAATVETMLAEGAIVVAEAERLRDVVGRLMADADARDALGRRASACVERNRGATARHAALLLEMMGVNGEDRGGREGAER